ncbi:MAG: PEP-CTERM sorting domain-containing protein [Rhodocyclaceae bacterium]|nr:PEP-CTERM sorting domain-containing protein [Rhodocyclaceae bacterium]
MYFLRPRQLISALVVAAILGSPAAFGYSFYKYGAGRADYADHYDFPGVMWPAQLGSFTYDFGSLGGFSQLPTGLSLASVEAAGKNAGNVWENWAYLSVADTLGATGTGNIRLTYDASHATGAFTRGYGLDGRDYAEIVFGQKAGATAAWDAINFEWTLTHELGHAFGLHDLYKYSGSPGFNEDFVDHVLNCATSPCRDDTTIFGDASRRDNIMDRYRFDSNDYSLAPQTFLDNDEIAGISWLWGGKYNQIVSGDLNAAWSGSFQWREIANHHGGEISPRTGEKGWWTYWGSFAPGTDGPCLTIDFPGFVDYQATILSNATNFPNATFRYDGNQGGSSERFCIEESNWIGNFILSMKSTVTEERYIDAVLHYDFGGNGRVDSFILAPNVNDRVYQDWSDTRAYFAQVFGPIPEPGTLWLFLGGMLVFWTLQKRRSRPTGSVMAA